MRKLLLFYGLLFAGMVNAQTPPTTPITFYEFTENIPYQRTPSESYAVWEALRQEPYVIDQMQGTTPYKAWGAPGVAIFDYDNDGDEDIYVTNGPNTNNSLYQNQRINSGELAFVDVGAEAGVGAYEQDSNGVCYGDTDNDGDSDLYVVGYGQNLFFENQGDGTFTDQTVSSGLGSQVKTGVGCSMGDINGDGLLDIVVANAFDLAERRALVTPFEFNQPNQLFLNLGQNVFQDVSQESGILENGGLPPGTAAITWAAAMVDYDLDGDVDIFFADDQAGVVATREDARRGIDRGFIQIFQNVGSGNFTNQTLAAHMPTGDWMGLAFGDLNCDGYLDVFATNFGDYFSPFKVEKWASRWFLGQADGTFRDSLTRDFEPTAFGWGTAMFDYDNDADLDIVYYGGDNSFWELQLSNPGIILQNQECSAEFIYDLAATQTRHIDRLVEGLAIGDLNNDGFPEIISVSSMNLGENTPIRSTMTRFGSPLNQIAGEVSILIQSGEGRTRWIFSEESTRFQGGSLSIEINSADNGNGWISVKLIGTHGITPLGRSNRDGIGAVIQFTPEGGYPVLKPVLSGGSYASQHSLIQLFGLGQTQSGTLEILWSGGTRNRLYDVQPREQLVLPEVPCDYRMEDFAIYQNCLDTSLSALLEYGIIDTDMVQRLRESAVRAFEESH